MWIFISRVPHSTTRNQLRQFVSQGLKSGLMNLLPFSSKASVGKCQLMKITDRESGISEIHGLVEVEPANMVDTIVERINGQKINGKPVRVHVYHSRSKSNDRRTPDEMPMSNDRRERDRRRTHLTLELVSTPKVEGVEEYHRMHTT
jgi:hypothetical protein